MANVNVESAYFSVPTSIGNLRFLYLTTEDTAQQVSQWEVYPRVYFIGETDVESVVFTVYNTSNFPMGGEPYGEHHAEPFTISDAPNLNGYSNGGTYILRVGSEFNGANLGMRSGNSIQFCVPCVIKTSDDIFIPTCILYGFTNDATTGEALRNYVSVVAPQPGYRPFGYFVGDLEVSTLMGSGAPSFDFPGAFARYVLNDDQRYVPIHEYFANLTPIIHNTDPYAPGGISEPDAGDGTFDFTSQPVDFQNAPSIGAYDTGMITIYVPSASELRSLASYLWAGAFDLENFRKLVADPMDAIIGLSILPVTAAEIGVTGSTLVVGNISTLLSMPRANRQYVVIDCGTVQILPKWGAYLDFAPYSKLQLFLPYIGFVDISPDDCMNGTISVKYTVDILSGTCVAQVKCKDHVLYEFSGTCSCSCPVTAGQYQNILLGAFRMAGALGSMAGAAVMNNIPGTANAITEAANTVLDSVKPTISRSGGFGGSSGLMGHQFPYLILTVPRLCLPERQNQMIGYPSYVTKTLGDITGFCKIDVAHLAGIPASEDEQNEILELLKEGVYL